MNRRTAWPHEIKDVPVQFWNLLPLPQSRRILFIKLPGSPVTGSCSTQPVGSGLLTLWATQTVHRGQNNLMLWTSCPEVTTSAHFLRYDMVLDLAGSVSPDNTTNGSWSPGAGTAHPSSGSWTL